jgi:hypothetical protein
VRPRDRAPARQGEGCLETGASAPPNRTTDPSGWRHPDRHVASYEAGHQEGHGQKEIDEPGLFKNAAVRKAFLGPLTHTTAGHRQRKSIGPLDRCDGSRTGRRRNSSEPDTGFPLSVLLGQHRQMSAEAAQLSSVQHQNSLLGEQRLQLNSNAEVKRLARQNYQLVEPGQTLYLILPPAGKSELSTSGASAAGDPANQPLVAPAQAPNMSPDPGLPATIVPATSGAGGQTSTTAVAKPSGGFWSRVGSTLQFWK